MKRGTPQMHLTLTSAELSSHSTRKSQAQFGAHSTVFPESDARAGKARLMGRALQESLGGS
jgi:hypothetical protein